MKPTENRKEPQKKEKPLLKAQPLFKVKTSIKAGQGIRRVGAWVDEDPTFTWLE